MERVYLDHNSTTPMRPQVLELYRELLDSGLANPSSLHAAGRRARNLVDQARERVAAALGVHEEEVVFTSGGTESNNLALTGVLRALGPGAGLVTTSIEHSSILGPAARLEEEGHPWARVGVDRHGEVDLDELAAGVSRPGAALVSVLAASNEIGVVAPLDRIAELLGGLPGPGRPRLHTDGVQALGKIPLQLGPWGVDLASFSLHKIGGPLGLGILVRRGRGVLWPLQRGGEQEHGLRPGTENAPAIAAGALAIELAVAELDDYRARVGSLATAFWRELATRLPDARLLGPPLEAAHRLPNTLAISIGGLDGKVLVTRLDLEGLEVSAGSACASGSLEPSHVLLAMGHDEATARSGLRISLGRSTTAADCRRAVEILVKVFSSSRAT